MFSCSTPAVQLPTNLISFVQAAFSEAASDQYTECLIGTAVFWSSCQPSNILVRLNTLCAMQGNASTCGPRSGGRIVPPRPPYSREGGPSTRPLTCGSANNLINRFTYTKHKPCLNSSVSI